MPPALLLSVPPRNRPNQRLPCVAPLSVAMLASDPQLMPDSADNGRPSAAPLSVEDADRLADSFTAFWDDAPAPTPAPPIAAARPPADSQPFGDPELVPVAAPIAEPAPHPGAVTQPMPAVAAVAKAKPLGKQTLVGIAPINIEKPSPSEPPPSSSPIQSSPSPAVPGYAIAYTPKDPPTTPAVVIAPEAQSAPDNPPPENRRALSQTVPSRVRSAPNASLSPPPPIAKPATPDASDDFNPYAPKKGKGKVIALMLVGTLLVGGSVFVVRGFAGGAREFSTQTSSAASPVADVVRAATVGAAAPTPEPDEPAPAPLPTPSVRESEPVAMRPVSGRTPKPKTKAKSEPTAPAVARAATRAASPEPSPPAPKPASKGVIVRDAPF